MWKQIHGQAEIEIIGEIAEGGMGAVYKARQKGIEGFEKIVAVKTLLSGLAGDEKFISMFISEAKLVANLVHENIVQIYQLGRCEDTYYFVLEYVDGISLYGLLDFLNHIKQRLPVELSVFIASRIARGLAYAHTRHDSLGNPLNIVHCDICPNNILINTEGLPKLTDFGIAKAANLAADRSLSGKIPFMAPEQAWNGELDHRADIYSLGVVLFNMLAGRSPRNLKSDFDIMLEEARSGHVDWAALPEGLPSELCSILNKMLAPKAEDRYPETQALARELEYFIYKDGYGPTIVTLADYLRKQLPYLFSSEAKIEAEKRSHTTVERTIRIGSKTS